MVASGWITFMPVHSGGAAAMGSNMETWLGLTLPPVAMPRPALDDGGRAAGRRASCRGHFGERLSEAEMRSRILRSPADHHELGACIAEDEQEIAKVVGKLDHVARLFAGGRQTTRIGRPGFRRGQ
jgi:hypothetical protein